VKGLFATLPAGDLKEKQITEQMCFHLPLHTLTECSRGKGALTLVKNERLVSFRGSKLALFNETKSDLNTLKPTFSTWLFSSDNKEDLRNRRIFIVVCC